MHGQSNSQHDKLLRPKLKQPPAKNRPNRITYSTILPFTIQSTAVTGATYRSTGTPHANCHRRKDHSCFSQVPPTEPFWPVRAKCLMQAASVQQVPPPCRYSCAGVYIPHVLTAMPLAHSIAPSRSRPSDPPALSSDSRGDLAGDAAPNWLALS